MTKTLYIFFTSLLFRKITHAKKKMGNLTIFLISIAVDATLPPHSP